MGKLSFSDVIPSVWETVATTGQQSKRGREREIRQPGVHALLDSQHAISTTIQYAEYTVYTNNSSWGLSNSNIHHFLLEVQLSIETILIIKD